MADEVPPHSSPATAIPSSPPLDPRKRALSPTSSEPPLFSSDDDPDAADVSNYESPRYKRKRVGPWWMTELPLGKELKAKISRNYDSGVWMASDISDSSDSFDGVCEFSSDLPLTVPQEEIQELMDRKAQAITVAEEKLFRYIEEKLEESNYGRYNMSALGYHDRYELCGLGLKDGDLAPLRLLNQVIRVPPGAGMDVPAPGQYRSFMPELYVTLANNSLSTLAPSLLTLDHLTTLILRNNKLQSLPPGITKLCNLKVLDLSLNQLEYLPVEILGLMHSPIDRVHVHGNPLLESFNIRRQIDHLKIDFSGTFTVLGPNGRAMYDGLSSDERALFIWSLKHHETGREGEYEPPTHHRHCPPVHNPSEYTRHTCKPPVQIHLMAWTPATYFDQAGSLVKGSPPSPSSTQPTFSVIVDTHAHGAYGVPSTWFEPPRSVQPGTPSLFTQSMKVGLQNASPAEIRELLAGGDSLSSIMEKQLLIAEDNIKSLFTPFHKCHCCGNDFVMPRAEWVEFWRPWNFDDEYIPVKARVCSWECVPDFIAKRPTRVIDAEPANDAHGRFRQSARARLHNFFDRYGFT
jgi:hypothetical protein